MGKFSTFKQEYSLDYTPENTVSVLRSKIGSRRDERRFGSNDVDTCTVISRDAPPTLFGSICYFILNPEKLNVYPKMAHSPFLPNLFSTLGGPSLGIGNGTVVGAVSARKRACRGRNVTNQSGDAGKLVHSYVMCVKSCCHHNKLSLMPLK